MRSNWQSTYDIQIDLLRFWNSPKGKLAGQGFGESMAKTEREYGNPAGEWLAHHIDELAIQSFALADPFYVDPDMMELVEAAAQTFKPEPLQPSDFITTSGFVVLPRSMYLDDCHGKSLAFSAFTWIPVRLMDATQEGQQDGVLLSLYSHAFDDEDDYSTEWPLAEREKIVQHSGTPWMLTYITPWAFGRDYPNIGREYTSWWTPIQSFLRLSLQTIADRHQLPPPRASTRRAMRAKMPKDKYITVIRLRRPKARQDQEPQSVDWRHRWIVNGHWRNQWFPGLQMHRQIWIGAYVKGPEDKPLLIRKGRAFELVR